MNRRLFLLAAGASFVGGVSLAGCRKKQFATVKSCDQPDAVGSHAAGAETFKPLVGEAVGKLLARQTHDIQQTGLGTPGPKRVCFVGVENKSGEELGDFKDQICETIDNQIVQSGAFQSLSRKFVQAGLEAERLRPDQLFLPANQRKFQAALEQQGQPFDYLLFASLTSGTTRTNNNMQRDYMLTLELVNLRTGQPDKEFAEIRKGYYKSRVAKMLGG